MTPLVTVLMPNYNNEAFLKEAIDSILNQSFSNFIFLIVDDGSTDKSVEIIKSFPDPRIRLILKTPNSGIVDTLNLGLEHVTTKYYVRMDGDDISVPDRIQKLVDYMELHPEVGVCGSHSLLFGDINEVWKMELNPQKIKAKLIYTNGMSHGPSIYRTEVIKKNNIRYTNDHPYMEDYDLFFRLKGLTEFAHLDEVLYQYRILKHNSTFKNRHTILERKKQIYKKVIAQLNIEPTEKAIDIHTQFFLGDVPLTYKINDYRKWADLLLQKNNELSIYPRKEFQELLATAWKRFFFKVVPMSLSSNYSYFKVSRGAAFHQLVYLAKVKFNKFIGRK
jgi:glycosyltransferase involved in cell wall biosynthesis